MLTVKILAKHWPSFRGTDREGAFVELVKDFATLAAITRKNPSDWDRFYRAVFGPDYGQVITA